MNGVIIVNKPYGFTSRDVVNILCKKFKTKKIGHTGTLDPIATGVLVICIGSATKLVEVLTSDDKEYIAELTLGTLTDTLDTTGNILKEENVKIDEKKIKTVLKDMIGIYEQEVPIYSAVKVNGKKLYEYAREGKTVELPKRMVNIKSIELVSDIKYINNKTIFSIKCHVSKGTYIRSLVNDIARKIGTIGIMSSLHRTKQGIFGITNSYTLEDIENNNYELLSIKDALSNITYVVATKELLFKIKNGARLENKYHSNQVLFLDEIHHEIALYKVLENDDTILKIDKMF